jgi:hypothetical protein
VCRNSVVRPVLSNGCIQTSVLVITFYDLILHIQMSLKYIIKFFKAIKFTLSVSIVNGTVNKHCWFGVSYCSMNLRKLLLAAPECRARFVEILTVI